MGKAYLVMTVVSLSGIAAAAGYYWWTKLSKLRKTKNWDNYR